MAHRNPLAVNISSSQNPSSPRRRGSRFRFNQCSNRINSLMQIKPVRIHLFNDTEFPHTIPFLDLLFTFDRVFHRMMMLIPNKCLQPIRLGDAFKNLVLVVTNSMPKRTRHANIDGAAIAVRYDVNGRLLLDRHSEITTNLRNSVNTSGIPACAGMTEYLVGLSPASRLYRNTAS
jgi:hypothetical protein